MRFSDEMNRISHGSGSKNKDSYLHSAAFLPREHGNLGLKRGRSEEKTRFIRKCELKVVACEINFYSEEEKGEV